MSDINTRKEKRTPVTLKIKFKSATLDQFIERYSVDVSQGGIFIRTKDPLAVGTQLKFEFQLQDATPLISGEGTVVWTREYDPARVGVAPGMGVRFDRLASESQEVLGRILLQKKKEGADPRFDLPTKAKPGSDRPRPQPAPLQAKTPDDGDVKPGLGLAPPRGGFPEEPSRDATPLPKPMPFHSSVDDDFGDDVFEQPTRVASTNELLDKVRAASGGHQDAEAAEDKAAAEAAKQAPEEEAAAEKAKAEAAKQAEEAAAAEKAKAEASKAAAEKAKAEAEKKPVAKVEGKKGGKGDGKKGAAKADAKKGVAKGEGEKKAEAKADEKKAEAKADEKKAEAKADDKKAEAKADDKKAEAKAGDKKAEAKADDKKAEAKQDQRPTADAAPERRSSNVMVALAVVVVVVGAGVAWYELAGPGKKPAQSEASVQQPELPPPPQPQPQPVATAPDAAPAAPVVPAGIEVQVATTPAGASVELDGVAQAAATPMALAGLDETKTYQVKIALVCHKDQTVKLTPKAGARIDVTLKPLPRAVRVESDPAGASISIDGRPAGKTPAVVKLSGDAAATHTVTLKKSGFETAETTVEPTAVCTTEGDKGVVAVSLTLNAAEPAPAAVLTPRDKPAAGSGSGTQGGAGGTAAGTGGDSGGGAAAGAGDTGAAAGGAGSGDKPAGDKPAGDKPAGGDDEKVPDWMK